MPQFDKQTLTAQAKELGFTRGTFEKVSRLIEILRFMESTDELSDALALKGGTAINLTIFDLPRLSVDIDMDFANNLPRDEMLEKRVRINEVIGRFMNAENYRLTTKTKTPHSLDSLVYAYETVSGSGDNLKIEINYSLRAHILPITKRPLLAGKLFDSFEIPVVAPIELFASKIVALITRGAVRDLYDVNLMFDTKLFNADDLVLLRKCAVFYTAVSSKEIPRDYSFDKIADISKHRVKTDLYPMIRNSERFDFESVKAKVGNSIATLMTLTEDEQAFLHKFADGTFEPTLLFNDEDIINRISEHPMVQWKVNRD
ncbi:MAG: nucleotidyl transferase AbiEii/AbiGii toxin family protein [Clostridiales Family XIII bacterium]|nr:nucleotidyl transferase AbiEii/AbiGii toxin family protein [Clostridiales Family XIII bacterium]